ncbi:MAG TPA: FGGY-family carbohydrate kinase [Dermatophilaceae bacterium]
MTTNDALGPISEAEGYRTITEGRAYLGMEFGSTRIKAALVDETGHLLAGGAHAWENQYVDDNWTYALEDVRNGLQACYADLATHVQQRWGTKVTDLAGVGVSAMMHGYLAFDAKGELLVPFRTWRNTYTTEAATLLTEAFGQNIPLRWSVSHLLHAVLSGEEHIQRLAHLATLAGYVHQLLSGRTVLGVGDASGMFPIDPETNDYDARMIDAFGRLDAVQSMPWKIRNLLPEVLVAGADAGQLTTEGAHLLDPTGTLRAGALMGPPEGDAGTGMVATNSVRRRTGNVSAGTSAFATVVLERPLSVVREEIDLVTTPAGDPVAMIHTNNCAGDLDDWMEVFQEFATLLGRPIDTTELYRTLFNEALKGSTDGGGLLVYNYLSGEHQTGVASGRPLFVRTQDARFTLANFMRAQLYGAFGALATGMKVLLHDEKVQLDTLFAHGGIFRTERIAQQILADALETPVSVGDAAGEGGAWGMALLAAFAGNRRDGGDPACSLSEFLSSTVFADAELMTVSPEPAGMRGHARWLHHYRDGLPVERLAGEVLN